MAGQGVIGALRVILGLDSASLENGLKNAESGLKRFAKSAATIASGIALEKHLTNAIDAFVHSIKRGVIEADKLGKMAQSFGVPVEELSRLKHAADLSDVSLESLGKSLGILSRNMSAAADGTGPAADAFRTLGISVTNAGGGLRLTEEIMQDIADRFAKMEDGAGKTAIAMAIFGRSGADLIPMLNMGKKGLQEASEEAEKLGIVLSERTAKSAEAFNDNLTRLGKVWDGVILRITTSLLPALEALSEQLVGAAKDADLVTTTGDTLAEWMIRIARLSMQTSGGIQIMTANFVSLANVAREIATGDVKNAIDAWNTGSQRMIDINNQVNASIDQLMERFSTVPIGQSMFGLFGGADESDKVAAKAIANQQNIDAERKKGLEILKEIDTEQRRIMEEFATPAEKMAADVQKINDAFARGVLTQEQFGIVSERMAARVTQSYGMAAANIIGSFGDIAESFGKENAAIAKAAQILGAVQALIATLVGQAEALKLPFPFNLAAAAAIAAKGFALVAAIKSANVPGFAQGGSFRVPGGSSFTDNKIMPIGLASGERVDITRPNDRIQGRELVIPSIRPRDFFTGETVRELVLAMNQWMRDGGTGVRFAT